MVLDGVAELFLDELDGGVPAVRKEDGAEGGPEDRPALGDESEPRPDVQSGLDVPVMGAFLVTREPVGDFDAETGGVGRKFHALGGPAATC